MEPGEIRLNKRAKVVSDGETGRRLILAEDSDDGSDHSPQFSSYAPRYLKKSIIEIVFILWTCGKRFSVKKIHIF